MRTLDTIFIVGWITFWIYWIVAAIRDRSGHVDSWRSVALRFGAALVVLSVVRTGILKGHTGLVDILPLQVIGVAIFLLGLALAIWARTSLGKNWGMPMTEKLESQLVTSGPYRYVRHPIYLGLILAMFGTAIAVDFYGLVALLLVGGYFVYGATVEERSMMQRFPNTYARYKGSTKMLIPFVL
jgi:protein-S-isoprenylcysteine O-methyltransferase Ste14